MPLDHRLSTGGKAAVVALLFVGALFAALSLDHDGAQGAHSGGAAMLDSD